MKKAFILAVLAILMNACASNAPMLQAPKIGVQDVQLQQVNFQSATALAQISVANPNALPLPLRGLHYRLSLAGHPIATGSQSQLQTIGPNQQTTLSIPVTLPFNQIMSAIPQVLSGKPIQYRFDGQIDVPLISIPFAKDGVLKLPSQLR